MKRTIFFGENFGSENGKHDDLHFNTVVRDGRNTDSKIMEKCRRIPAYESCIRSSLLNQFSKILREAGASDLIYRFCYSENK